MERFMVSLNGKSYEVEVERLTGAMLPSQRSGVSSAPVCATPSVAVVSPAATPKPAAAPAKAETVTGSSTVCAPMPGKILSINAKPGDGVKRGDVLLILEAMKMQNEIMAPVDGKIADIRITVGQSVATGDVMVILS